MVKKDKQPFSLSPPWRLGIDLMGCGVAPADVFAATLTVASQLQDDVIVTVFATQEVLCCLDVPPFILAEVAGPSITMDDLPSVAVRRKSNASLCKGIDFLRQHRLDAFISAGNTGALVTSATLKLRCLPSIRRAALMTLLPTRRHPVAVLDVGANVVAKAAQLVECALMGIAYQKSRGILTPTVGLLNMGAESKKGPPELRAAYEQISSLSQVTASVFLGNIEGRDVFNGNVNVLVTDGFSGNIFLKTAEGIAGFILEQVGEMAQDATDTCFFRDILYTLKKRLAYAEYPGAMICGVEGLVIKCHGDGDPTAFSESMKAAVRLLAHDFLGHLRVQLLPHTAGIAEVPYF